MSLSRIFRSYIVQNSIRLQSTGVLSEKKWKNQLNSKFLQFYFTNFSYFLCLKDKNSEKNIKMTSKTALAILAEGTEEMEIVITVDVLRRAGVSSRQF